VAFDTWLLFCFTEATLCLVPGPAVLMVVSVAMTLGSRGGLRAVAGVLAANFVYFSLAATGLAAVIAASYEVFSLIKWLGAGYLVWIGVVMIRDTVSRSNPSLSGPVQQEPKAANPRVRPAFRHGLITQAANPKLLIFFTAIVPQFIDPNQRLGSQMAILGLSSIVIEFAVLWGYVVVAGRAGQAVAPRMRVWVERIGGGLLIGAGAGLARVGTESN
jgi:homoserine/homoserine lactone efflux protein